MTGALEVRLVEAMERAVEHCVAHVEAGGLPFVGVVLDTDGTVLSAPGVNRVQETGDPLAHAEIVAMREVLTGSGRADLSGTLLLATGEPCGLCYRFAIDHGVERVHVAVDRDEVARWGFDYRPSYRQLGISDERRTTLLRDLSVARGLEPFVRFARIHAAASPSHTHPKGKIP